MAEKNSRKFARWRIKYVLAYSLIVVAFIALLIGTIVYLDKGAFRIIAITYESLVLSFAIGLPIGCIVIAIKRKAWKCIKEKQQKKEYISKEDCDIYAK